MDAERMGESSTGGVCGLRGSPYIRNLISALSAAAFEHALSTNVTLTQSTPYYLLPNHLNPRKPFTDMDHLIGCASSSVQLLALFANPPTANASTSYLRAKFGKLAGGPS